MRGNEYLAAVRADGDLLVLETLSFADEVSQPHQQISNLPGRIKLTRQELRMARQLIESMTGPWQPSDYRDTYTDRVNDLTDSWPVCCAVTNPIMSAGRTCSGGLATALKNTFRS